LLFVLELLFCYRDFFTVLLDLVGELGAVLEHIINPFDCIFCLGEIATALLEYSRRNGHITATVDLLALLQVTQQLLHLIQACRVLLNVI